MSKKFATENLGYFNTYTNYSHYTRKLATAPWEARYVYRESKIFMWETDAYLLDTRGNKMQDEDAAAELSITPEQFNKGLKILLEWGLWQTDEDGVIYDPELIDQMKGISEKLAIDAARKREERKLKREAADRFANESSDILDILDKSESKESKKSTQEERSGAERKKEDSSAIYKRERSKSPAPGGVDTPPVDNSAPLHSTQISQYHSQIEELITAIKTTGAGVCKDLDNPKRRSDLETQLANIIKKNGDPVHWLAGMNEALKYAGENPQTEAGEILAKFRQYPDGIQDNGKDSRCEQLIRVVSKAKPYGACAKFLGKSIPGNLGFSGNYDDLDTYDPPQEEYDPKIDPDNPF